ncbi:ankyrin repeat domain-containing protein [Alienimonas chondri]|uniref:Ankyrin repeat domain-containing protein n=1 Tax=Alienimonas chondri TaxID=2681879 RepID=A0ABX1VG50_9PLAN|nr:hypothetical protein [Alienimonas chondri]NNJ27103.1 hypothetical protein [Alienimonas chondri]
MSPADPSRPIAERRGAFEPYPGWTWEALLVRSDGDPADALAACEKVGAVERNVTADVLGGAWEPPAGDWALLVALNGHDWATLAIPRRYPSDVRDESLSDFDGETLLTGYQDTAGSLHLLHRRPGPDGAVEATRFETDGDLATVKTPFNAAVLGADEDFDPDEFDDDSFLDGTLLTGAAYPPETAAAWLADRDDAADALNTLLDEAGAYVPLFAPVGDGPVTLETYAGHEDALAPEHVARIDLIRFGRIPKAEPTKAQIAAGRKLAKAVRNDDLAGVRAALAKGATVGELPDDHCTALWRACDAAGGGQLEHGEEIVAALLDAGADPNAPAAHPDDATRLFDHALSRVVSHRSDESTKVKLVRLLAAAGSDLNPASGATIKKGDRPLHTAALKGYPAAVEALLEAGADPLAENVHGRTPRQQLAYTREANAKYFKPSAEEQAADARSAELLLAAERSRGD